VKKNPCASIPSGTPVDHFSVQHSESRYDEARYSHLPPGPVFSEFEDAQIVFRYGRTMQDEDMTPPQLLCPRPTLPLSRFAHHSSWSDRPSEAPINAYRAYSEPSSNQQPTSFIPRVHSPQAGEKQYSFENHRALVVCCYICLSP